MRAVAPMHRLCGLRFVGRDFDCRQPGVPGTRCLRSGVERVPALLAIAAEFFPGGRRSRTERPRTGVPNERGWFVGGGRFRRAARHRQVTLGAVPPSHWIQGQRARGPHELRSWGGERGAKPRVNTALPPVASPGCRGMGGMLQKQQRFSFMIQLQRASAAVLPSPPFCIDMGERGVAHHEGLGQLPLEPGSEVGAIFRLVGSACRSGGRGMNGTTTPNLLAAPVGRYGRASIAGKRRPLCWWRLQLSAGGGRIANDRAQFGREVTARPGAVRAHHAIDAEMVELGAVPCGEDDSASATFNGHVRGKRHMHTSCAEPGWQQWCDRPQWLTIPPPLKQSLWRPWTVGVRRPRVRLPTTAARVFRGTP